MKHLNNGQAGRSLIEFDSVRDFFALRVFTIKRKANNFIKRVDKHTILVYYNDSTVMHIKKATDTDRERRNLIEI